MRRACVFLLAAVAGAGEAPLAYRLAPGTELVFEGHLEGGGGGTSFDGPLRINLWVVRVNRDGSFRVVVRHEDEFRDPQLGLGDLRANGTYHPQFRGLHDPFPGALFPPLPGAWQHDKASLTKHDVRYAFRRRDAKDTVVLSFTKSSPEDRVFEVASTHQLHLDRKRGLPTRLETRFSQGYGARSSGHTTLRLTGTRPHAPDTLERLAGEVEAAHRARRAYTRHFDACRGRPDAVAQHAEAAEAILERAIGNTTRAEVREVLQEWRAGHAARVEYAHQEAEQIAKRLDRPAPAWRATDFAGRDHSLAGHRGRVIVLDCWYRGCGWCIKAMPQVKAIARHFAGRPVVVLGVNVDPDEQDARLVIETMALDYPTLKAPGLPKQLGVRGYPTLIVIDQQGVVRDYRIGYAADLEEQVIATVEALLEKGR
ncbi:MAG: TlpA family protein disulfide reductase [Planctomycetota bacterium]